MIIGIGTDIIQIERIEKVFAKYGNTFKNKILSGKEIEKLDSMPLHKHASFLAKRFAAKEAISKAFGTGISDKLAFKDIIILNNEAGKPYVEIEKNKTNYLSSLDNIKIDLSLADDYPVAIAFSVISVI